MGKNILITGGTKGIGAAIVKQLCKITDYTVIALYSSDDSAAVRLKNEIHTDNLQIIKSDISDYDNIQKLAATIKDEYQCINVLINNAGIADYKTYKDVTYKDWIKTIQVNLSSTFMMIQAFLPLLELANKSKIINMSSIAAFAGGIVGPHYTASKAGQIGLTHYYAKALAHLNITVNSIAPALIETDMISNKINPDTIPLKRLGKPDEIYSAVAFLMENDFITGQTIHINGGLLFS